jgi:hypothetical protein
MFIYAAILLMGIIGFFIHLFVSKQPKTPLRIVELFLVYQLVFSLGLSSFLAFFGLMFMTQFVADYSGWPACPFEKLLANVNLGYGVLGILCIWYRGTFWFATILGSSIWLIADGITHLADLYYNNNTSPGNIGMPLYTDIIVPVVLIILYVIYQRLSNKSPQSQ